MPLRAGNSEAVKRQNIREFHTGKTYAHTKAKFGKKRADAQAVAVALSTARKYRKRADGGSDDPTREVGQQRLVGSLSMPASGSRAEVGQEPAIPQSLRDRAIGVATDWLSRYGHLVGGLNRAGLGIDPSNPEELGGFQKGLQLNPAVGAYQGIQGLMDANKAAVDARRRADTMPGSEEEIYAANQQAEEAEKNLAGSALMTGVGLVGGRGPFAKPGELGAFGGKPPAEGKFFHPYDLDPAELKGAKQVTGPKGSNPGGTYELASGEPVYIKTPKTIDHTYNEKLAAELYKLAGVPVADVKMTKFGGQPSIVSPIIPGKVLKDVDPSAYSLTSDLGQHHPADLWLGNYDWVGTGKDNVIVDPTGKAWRIDTGGALRYRAQGALKGPDMWGPEVKPFDLNKSPDMADVMDFTPKKWEQPTAERVSKITDDQIRGLVDKYGPLAKGKKEELANTLIARRDGIAKMYGIGGAGGAPPSTAKNVADLLMKKYGDDKISGPGYPIAGELNQLLKSGDHESVNQILEHLPADIQKEVKEYLGPEMAQKNLGELPDAMWHGDDPSAEPPMGPEGWGNEHESNHVIFKFTNEPHWWDNLGKYGTIHTPEKPPGGWTVQSLSANFKNPKFARSMTNAEWQNYKPPTTGGHGYDVPKEATPQWLKFAKSKGANINFVLKKGYNPYLQTADKMEQNEFGHVYPKEIEDPKNKSHGYMSEHANYLGDAEEVSTMLNSTLSAPYFVAAKKPIEIYYPAFAEANPSKAAAHRLGEGSQYNDNLFVHMIHAAHKNGHDLMVLHGVNDVGSTNHTQYLILSNQGVLKGVGAPFKEATRPLGALIPAIPPAAYSAYKSLNQKDDSQ